MQRPGANQAELNNDGGEIFESNVDPLHKIMEDCFFDFLQFFELQEDDPNYAQYKQIMVDEEEQRLAGDPIKYYQLTAKKMIHQEKTTMSVDFQHLAKYHHNDGRFLTTLVSKYLLHEVDLKKALTNFMAQFGQISMKKRQLFQVSIFNLPQLTKIREMRTTGLGRLQAISGTVTRTTDSKPELLSGSFTCMECNTVVAGIEQQFKYTEPVMCTKQGCNNRSMWTLNAKESIMIDWQKVRLQEDSGEIPAGSMPRCVDVILRGEMVDVPKPGDKAVFTGKLVVVPDIVQLLKPGEKYTAQNVDPTHMKRTDGRQLDGVTGMKQVGVKDLSYKMVFIACNVHNGDSRFGFEGFGGDDAAGEEDEESIQKKFTLAEREKVQEMKFVPDLFPKLASSIAPSVSGHLDVKKGILLQLFGGIQKRTADGMKIRGDINNFIVGDPATAKSQFLKYITQFLPRAIYTSGKASSAAGLTASVLKDPETGDFCIEAGALMLADHGICCIDEFDKMDGKDQVAIHEAMEQQTISLAKAGIHATLNARASILAAANPIYGRYDRSRTLRYNLNISAPIMSRFDIFFLIFDEKNDEADFNIAHHIVNMHRSRGDAIRPEFAMEDMQTYIKFCRTINPRLCKQSAEILKNEYVAMRQREKQDSRTAYKVTIRQLEAMIRLSEALARVNCDEEIKPQYVKEVARILRNSNVNVRKDDIEFTEIQDEINRVRAEDRAREQQQAAQMAGVDESQTQAQPEASQQEKKQKISFEDYQKISMQIIDVMKEFEAQGGENVQQSNVVNRVIQKMMLEEDTGVEATQEQAVKLSKIITHVVSYLINKENVLMISQDAKIKNERFLCLNVNVEREDMQS